MSGEQERAERRVRDFVANWNGEEEHEITCVYLVDGSRCYPLDHEDLEAVVQELDAVKGYLHSADAALERVDKLAKRMAEGYSMRADDFLAAATLGEADE